MKAFEQSRRILIEWGDPPSAVDWLSSPRAEATTFVTISSWGFHGSDDEVVRQAIDSTGGFSLVLAGAKALLEHGIELNLVADHHPTGDEIRRRDDGGAPRASGPDVDP